MNAVARKRRSTHNHLCGPLTDESQSAFGAAHSTANPAARPARQHFDNRVVGTAAHRGVEVDHLYLRKTAEALQHHQRRFALEGLLFALDKLDYFAVL